MADDRGEKRKFPNARMSQGGRGSGRGSHSGRGKGRDMGRKEFSRQRGDRRETNDERSAKRQKTAEDGKPSVLPGAFPAEEVAAEARKPKHKVAVCIGYSGTGYRGMQINTTEKTIEGDLFTAFVAAGAISKANADDPKKSQLVRCARTDKGVHAAGNVISLKLIIEDDNIIEKINANLSSQIRVWGFERTVNSFSCYQACDSRWYEYLIPTHAFVPPHPDSYLGRTLVQFAQEAGDEESYRKRQAEVANFWAETEENYVKPILETLDEDIRDIVMKAMYDPESDLDETPVDGKVSAKNSVPEARLASLTAAAVSEDAKMKVEVKDERDVQLEVKQEEPEQTKEAVRIKTESGNTERPTSEADAVPAIKAEEPSTIEVKTVEPAAADGDNEAPHVGTDRKNRLEMAIKKIRNAYMTAKRAYRIPDSRKERVAEALKPFLGTRNFHNYTVDKTFRDPSAQRHIKSFNLNPKPIVINGTEWLSIKIHGQSFMMHQIRKMISMIALTVRCGCPVERISESFRETTISIPKVPGLGLLLERPVFDSYNEGAASKFNREKIDFSKYEKEMEEFKQKEIYERIFREEADGNQFHTFFAHVDSFREGQFLYLTSKGLDAIKGLSTTRGAGAGTGDKGKGKQTTQTTQKKTEVDSDDEREHREDN